MDSPLNTLWIEKYRPKTLEELVLEPDTERLLRKFLGESEIPHLLLVGHVGSGKTTIAKILLKTLDCDSLTLNASDERGIQTVRDKIKSFAMMNSFRQWKIVFLDEADALCLSGDTLIMTGSKDRPIIRKLSDMKYGRKILIPSVNLKTRQIENDIGWLVDSGSVEFYDVELEDGRVIRASANHPFFTKGLQEIKVKDMQVGTEIIDFSDEILHPCAVCKKPIVRYRQVCSRVCASKLHASRVRGCGNPRYNQPAWNRGLTKDTDKRVAKQANKGKSNGNYKGIWHGKQIWRDGTPEQKARLRARLSALASQQTWDDHNRAIRSIYGKDGFLDSNYRRYLKGKSVVNCECCGKCIKVGDCAGIYVHHKDGNRKNNKRSNLLFVCPRCHNVVCHGRVKCK